MEKRSGLTDRFEAALEGGIKSSKRKDITVNEIKKFKWMSTESADKQPVWNLIFIRCANSVLLSGNHAAEKCVFIFIAGKQAQ
jgi:hypothetical protein